MTVGAGMDSGAAPPEGLRARKRAAARSSIEETAITLALEHGYEHLTVEMICTAGMVSQRTFFNYFGSKEGVFLDPVPAATVATVARCFRADGGTPVVLSLAGAVVAALLAGSPDPELARGRMKVIMDSPELLAKQDKWLAVLETQLADLVLERYAGERRREPEPELAAEARMVVGLALGVVRVVLRQTLSDDDDGGCPGADALECAEVLLGRIFGTPDGDAG